MAPPRTRPRRSRKASSEREDFARVLGPGSIMALVVGGIIGSGIFIIPGIMAAQSASPLTVLLVFVGAGFLSLFGALIFAELGGMFPGHGGQYRYLKESLGRGPAFLFGWVMFWVIETGIIAAVAIAFGRFGGVVFGWEGAFPSALAALAAIWVLTFINWLGVRQGAFVQNTFTLAKTAALVALVGVSLLLARPEHTPLAPFSPPDVGGFALVPLIALMGLAAIFAYDGWFNVTFVTREAKRPQRDVPIGLAVGIFLVIAVYALAILAYFWVLPVEAAGESDVIAAEVARVTMGGTGAVLVALAVMVSTFGAVNSVILAGPRLYHAVARDGLFWHPFTKVNARFHTPGRSLLFQAEWASIIVVVSVPARDAYLIVINAVVVAIWIFMAVTAVGYFRLRVQRPDLPRPYRALGYPVVPALFLVTAAFIVVAAAVADAQLFLEHGFSRETFNGLTAFWAFLLTATGIPVWVWVRRRDAAAADADT